MPEIVILRTPTCPEARDHRGSIRHVDPGNLLENGVDVEHACENHRLHDVPRGVREGSTRCRVVGG